MKNALKMLGITVIAAVIGFSMVACGDNGGDDSTGGGGDPPPETLPVADRWWKYVDSTATLDYSIDEDGVCTIIVGGTPEREEEGAWFAWKAMVGYNYTTVAGKSYEYKFEAWTESGTRDLHFKYYEDNAEGIHKNISFPITTTRTPYTVRGDILPKSWVNSLHFESADKIGTYYVKILEIKEFEN